MADPEQPVQPHDFTQGDVETYRRGRNQLRRKYRRRGRRDKWLTIVEEQWPEKHAELLELRRYNPMGFRKELAKAAKKLGIYEYVNRTSPRELPPLEERRAAAEDDE